MNENKLEDSKGFAALLRLVRPKQWIKNGFIFLPLFFGGALLHTDALLAGLITFFAYSFAASSIYCFNDIFDVEADRRHPVKCHRPIASGAVSIKQAYGLMFLMFAQPIPSLCIPDATRFSAQEYIRMQAENVLQGLLVRSA